MPRNKYYVVTVGTEWGIYTRWTDVAARILHVPGNAHQSFRDFYEAQDALNDAIRNGEVRAVPRPPRQINQPPSPRRAQENHREQHQHQHPSPSAPGGSRGTSAASRARRDALIAATLDEIERERQRGEVSSARAAGTGQTSTRADAVVPQAISAPVGTTQRRQHPIRASFAAGRLTPRHPDFASRPPAHTIDDNVARPSCNASTSSSPPTQVTVLEHGSDSAPSLSPHQRAQSLPHTFRQSPELCVTDDREPRTVAGPSQKRHLTADGGDQIFPADYSTRALARFPVDRRSDISSPSTGVTRYFPRDYLTQARDETDDLQQSPPQIDIGSPASACYVTPPGSAYTQCAELPNDSPVSVAPTATPSSPSASSAPSRPQHSKIEKSFSDAAIQVDIQTRRQGCAQAAIQISGEKVCATTEAQMSPRPSTVRGTPLRATASAGDVLDRPRVGETCTCPCPKLVCQNCGLPVPTDNSQPVQERQQESSVPEPDIFSTSQATFTSTPSRAPSSRSSPRPGFPSPRPSTPKKSPAMRSSSQGTDVDVSAGRDVHRLPTAEFVASPSSRPLSATSPTSARTSRVSAPSPVALSSSPRRSPASTRSAQQSSHGHTPLLGPSERRTESIITMARLQEGLNTLVPSSPARTGGSENAVLHDTTFDPRSPIQRETLIPSSPSHGNIWLRPSPTMLPLDSLLFSS